MFFPCCCTRCQRTLRILSIHEGKNLRCPGCDATIVAAASAEASRKGSKAPAVVGKSPAAARSRLLLWILLAPAALAVLGYGLTRASPLRSALGSSPSANAVAPVPAAMPGHPSYLALNKPNSLGRLSPEAEALLKSQMQGDSSRSVYRDLQPAAQLGDLLAATVCERPDGDRSALVTTASGCLKEFSYPDFHLRTVYQLQGTGYRTVADGRRGTLWVAACEPADLHANRHGDQPRGRADLHCYDIPRRGEDGHALSPLRPRRVLPLASDVLELLISPDNTALFCLARGNQGVHLQRIDAERQAVHRRISLPRAIRTLCLSPDGKTLYAAGGGGVLVLDPVTLQTRRRVPVKIDVRALAADNEACLYLAEQGQWTQLTRLDLRGERPDLQQWASRLHGRLYIKLASDQHRLYVGTSSAITDQIDSLLVRGHHWETPLVLGVAVSGSGGRVRGEIFLTPDGRFLVNRWGTVYRLAQADSSANTRLVSR